MKGVSSIVGVVLLIAITVIAAIALYFMISNQQVNTNVQFGKLELADCQYNYSTNDGATVIIKVRNMGTEPITGVNATLFDENYNQQAYNDTYTREKIGTTGLTTIIFKDNSTGSTLYEDAKDNKSYLDNKYIIEFEGPVKLNKLELVSCKHL